MNVGRPEDVREHFVGADDPDHAAECYASRKRNTHGNEQ